MVHLMADTHPDLDAAYAPFRAARKASHAAGEVLPEYVEAREHLLATATTMAVPESIRAAAIDAINAENTLNVAHVMRSKGLLSTEEVTQVKTAVAYPARIALGDALHTAPNPVTSSTAATTVAAPDSVSPASTPLASDASGFPTLAAPGHTEGTLAGVVADWPTSAGTHPTGPASTPPPAEVAAVPGVDTTGAVWLGPGARHQVITSDDTEVHVVDKRTVTGAAPLRLNPHSLARAVSAAGVKGGTVKIVLADDTGGYGHARVLPDGTHQVVLSIAAKDTYSPGSCYVMNNSLVHELRHVAQQQADPGMGAKYTHANATVGYQANPYEVEAWAYGRLADHTGKKEIPTPVNGGTALAGGVWAITP